MRLRRRKEQPKRATRPASVAPTPDPVGLSAHAIHGHLLTAPDGTWAWFRLGPQQWRFKSATERAAILDASTIRWADLAGYRVHLRRTAHPTPWDVWARKLDRATPHPLPTGPGAPSWPDYLVGAQTRIHEMGARTPTTYLGVRITGRRHSPDELAQITDYRHGNTNTTIIKTRDSLEKVADTIRKEGFNGRPVTSRQLGWLIHASVGLGVPVSVDSLAGDADGWLPHQMTDFSNPVRAYAPSLASTTTLHVLRNGDEHQRHVAVLEVGRMSDRDGTDPSRDPWMAHSDRMPFPVEWSAMFDVLDGPTTAGSAEFTRRRAESLEEHYREHDETPPPAVGRGIEDAVRIEDEVNEGDREVAVRLTGPIYAAVSAETEHEAKKWAGELASAYSLHEKIALHHGYGQYDRYRAFIPGELSPAIGFQRWMPAYYAVTAVPNVASRIGDAEGPYLGMNGHSAVFFDPTFGPRNRGSGLVLIGGGLGSGKSSLGGAIAEPAARRGHRVVIFDPSGPLARLCDLPHLAPNAQHVELSGAEAGTLNPYWLVPQPRAGDFSERGYQAAVREADAERRDLATDALTMLLPPQVIERNAAAAAAIERVVNACGGSYATNPWRVVRALEAGNDVEREIGGMLRSVATMKGASLIFPADEHAATVEGTDSLPDATLTVLTMRGMVTPPTGVERAHWNRAERMAAPVLHLAARYAMRAMYADQAPKVILTDETGIIAAGASSFRSFLNRGALDSRKNNAMFGVLSQNPAHLLKIDPEIVNIVGAAFWGRATDEGAAAAALRILGVPDGHGYEKVLRNLEHGVGDFVMRDWHGNVDRVRIDLGWRPDLLDALDTNPPDPTVSTYDERAWTDELVVDS